MVLAGDTFETRTTLSVAPHVEVLDAFASDAELRAVLARAEPEVVDQQGWAAKADETGFSFEMPVPGDGLLEEIHRRMAAALEIAGAHPPESFRFRRYRPGEGHPPHCDHFQIGASWLVGTAMLCLTGAHAGGETEFPLASPPLSVASKPGRLLYWKNHRADGVADELALHEGREVIAGTKTTVTWFIYMAL